MRSSMRRSVAGAIAGTVAGTVAGAIAMLLIGALPARAGTPDFSGRWRLDVARSDFGNSDRPKPRDTVNTIEQGKLDVLLHALVVRANGDTVRFDWNLPTDGREVTNTMMGQDVKTTGHWDGDTLRVESKATFMMSTILTSERWTVSRDRRSMRLVRETRTPMGSRKQTMVYARL